MKRAGRLSDTNSISNRNISGTVSESLPDSGYAKSAADGTLLNIPMSRATREVYVDSKRSLRGAVCYLNGGINAGED